MSQESKIPFFEIIPKPDTYDGTGMFIDIKFGFRVLSTDKQENGMICCYIPALDIHFYCMDKEQIQKMAGIVGKNFMSHWINQESFPSFIRQLKVLGYEPTGGVLDWKRMLNDKRVDRQTTFKSRKHNTVPETFVGASQMEVNQGFQMAY